MRFTFGHAGFIIHGKILMTCCVSLLIENESLDYSRLFKGVNRIS